MKESSKNSLMTKLQSLIKTELSIVYVTTNNRKFLSLSEAIDCESEEEKKRVIIRKNKEMIMKIYELLSKVLSKNEWGIYFKGEPIEGFPTQDGMRVYRVNEIAPDTLYDAIEQESIKAEKEWQEKQEGKT
jgi:excinuclease UvrABC helicase subunit UvrB